jgi:hypothetical protein
MTVLIAARIIHPLVIRRRRPHLGAMILSSDSLILRSRLLDLHRAVIDFERAAHVRRSGKLYGAAFLRLLIDDREYRWLQPLSALIVKADEDAEAPAETELEAEFFAEARALVRPDAAGSEFQQRYAALIEQSPDVAYAHGATVQVLKRQAASLH